MNERPGVLSMLHAFAALLLACGVALVIQLAPLGLRADARQAPDLYFCVLAFFSLRRPDVTGPFTLFVLALLHDFLTGGPLGAGALCMLLTCEALKLRASVADAGGQPRSIWRDWLAASIGAAAVLLGQWILMLISFAGPPPLTDLATRWLLTALAFPLVAACMRYALGIRRRAARRRA